MDQPSPCTSKTVEDEYSAVQRRLRRRPVSLAQALNFFLCPEDNSDLEDLSDEDEDPSDPSFLLPDPDNNPQEEEIEEEIESGRIEADDHNSEDDHEDVEIARQNATSSGTAASKPSKRRDLAWRKVDFVQPDAAWKDHLVVDQEMSGKTPLEFVRLFFDQGVVNHIRDQTKIYALQKDAKEFGVSSAEVECFLGILAFTGIVKMPSYRSYWSNETRYPVIADAMSRDKFEQIKKYLHFNDNLTQKPRGDPGHDKIHKVRPLIEMIRDNFMKIPPEEHQPVDEQIVPTKQRISLKQYNPKKPHKWGYKFISRDGESGFDLAQIQSDQGILTLATVRASRLKGCALQSDSKLKARGRGSYNWRVETQSNAIVVKWYDNKPVHLISTYAALDPEDTCRRWDGKRNEYADVKRPYCVKEYNRFMGGVDLADMLLELYRIDFKSRSKWYMRIFFFLFDLSVVNGWLLYRRCLAAGQKPMNLLQFKTDVARALLSGASLATPKRGRPFSDADTNSQKKRNYTCRPPDSTRLDGQGHFPAWIESKQRYRVCVQAHSKVKCVKCEVSLFFTPNRNCFLTYHTM
ncbi:piggyBac transposable element-derived protein 2-like [Artemia franciscana]|uniref:piggyBac transposable element-derived protein 2-like n=1 Tax=Artemia franciscana TaxID=6661 RepID=UPI0032D9EB21